MIVQRKSRVVNVVIALAGVCFADSAGMAQSAQAGKTATVASGVIGQRQTSTDSAPNLQPLGRINNRLQNRVQSRINNRIDKFYVPQADAASPLAGSSNQAWVAARGP